MARKSRKETAGVPAPEIDTTCRAGVYVRLSVEDKHTRTASIETQQLIIARYLEQNPEIIVVQTYIDNGCNGYGIFTGPASSRYSPILKRALSTVSLSKIFPAWGGMSSTLATISSGIFPHRGFDFIAVNDRYDSPPRIMPMMASSSRSRNMINEAYALDIAKKIKAQAAAGNERWQVRWRAYTLVDI